MWQGVPSIGAQTSKPVIAAVKGWCIGGSYVIVQMCDLVVAADNTRFKYPEAQLGFTGGLIASAVARIPHKVAMEFMLLGEDFDAHRALAAGMVNKVVPTGEEEAQAQAWAKILANSAPLVVQGLKEFSMATLNKSPAEAEPLQEINCLASNSVMMAQRAQSIWRKAHLSVHGKVTTAAQSAKNVNGRQTPASLQRHSIKTRTKFLHEKNRLLKGGKMSAAIQFIPIHNIRIAMLRPAARRSDNLFGENAAAGGQSNLPSGPPPKLYQNFPSTIEQTTQQCPAANRTSRYQ